MGIRSANALASLVVHLVSVASFGPARIIHLRLSLLLSTCE